MTAKPWENIRIPPLRRDAESFARRCYLRLAGTAGLVALLSVPCLAGLKVAASSGGGGRLSTQSVEALARELKDKDSRWAYGRLRGLASQKSSGVLGMRAALALGRDDYAQARYTQAAKWLGRAEGDPLLGDYALYWKAQADLALNNSSAALAELQQLRQKFPESLLTEPALEALGQAALGASRPADAIVALDAYPSTEKTSALLFLRAEACEQAGKMVDAAADYQSVYLDFPLSSEAGEAASKAAYLRDTLGDKLPQPPLNERLAYAATLYTAGDWNRARDEYAEILTDLSGADRERAEMRILACAVQLGAGPAELAALQISDPGVDAEREHALAEYSRSQNDETGLVAAVEAAASRAPSSEWTEASLMLAGNYYWVQLARDQASLYYARVARLFPDAPDADAALWRIAWTAVLKRQPDAAELLAGHMQRFPESSYTSDTLYWLGRLTEEAGNAPLARSYYEKLSGRYPQAYFGKLGAARLRSLGPGPMQEAVAVSALPPLPPAASLDLSDPPPSAWEQRASALRMVAFDSDAEAELQAGFAATGNTNLLLEAAREAVAAEHYGAAIVMVRRLYPRLESRTFTEVPRPVWLAAYALPYANAIRHWSGREKLDPMLVAGLIHQESAFNPKARSDSDAIGLMQLLPKTARGLARQARVRYARYRLTDPEYNVRLGTAYIANLQKQFSSVELALAAYNAGEDRVASWTAGQTYREPAEFVDSIPFTETREYVQIVLRNADIYRRLYGAHHEPREAGARGAR